MELGQGDKWEGAKRRKSPEQENEEKKHPGASVTTVSRKTISSLSLQRRLAPSIMQIKTVLLALVATVSADNLLRPAQVPAVAARAAGTSDQCTAALFSLAATAPAFAPDLESFAETATLTG